MDKIETFNLAENPNEITLLESEVVGEKYDGEPVTLVRIYIEGEWVTQFGMTDTVLLAFYHKVKKVCQNKGLI